MPRRRGDTHADIEERHRRVIELSNRGITAAVIAETLGMSTTQVFRIRGKQRESKRRRPFGADEIALITSLLEGGASYYEVGRTVDRHPQVLRRRWPGYSWTPEMAGEYGVLRVRERFPKL